MIKYKIKLFPNINNKILLNKKLIIKNILCNINLLFAQLIIFFSVSTTINIINKMKKISAKKRNSFHKTVQDAYNTLNNLQLVNAEYNTVLNFIIYKF